MDILILKSILLDKYLWMLQEWKPIILVCFQKMETFNVIFVKTNPKFTTLKSNVDFIESLSKLKLHCMKMCCLHYSAKKKNIPKFWKWLAPSLEDKYWKRLSCSTVMRWVNKTHTQTTTDDYTMITIWKMWYWANKLLGMETFWHTKLEKQEIISSTNQKPHRN